MIHEISPHRFDNRYQADKNTESTDYILHFKENTVLLKTHGTDLELPRKEDFSDITEKTDRTFLFTFDDVPCYLIGDDLKADDPGFVYEKISFFRNTKQQELAWITMAGFHLQSWYSQNKFCGKCGSATQHKHDERALICPGCKTVFYPKISPAVIAAIVSNDKILLIRGNNFPGRWYSLPAGYADIGESLEETLVREVKEEVGLDIWNIRYYKSQPWPLSGSMMIGFIAEADASQPIHIDTKELAAGAWFTRGNLPEHSLSLSIAGEMIEKFERGEL